MENRKPFQLRGVLIVYNAIQVVFSSWIFYEACISGWLNGYSLRCEPVEMHGPKAQRMAAGAWWYFFSKFTEFFDTLFFVLRKRYDQVSTLHVIHHGIMPVSVWWGVKFTPGGHSTFFGFLNTFVHIIMYTYYMLAAMGPKVQKYLWWKKYLTVLQMVREIRKTLRRGSEDKLIQIFHSPFVAFIGPVRARHGPRVPVALQERLQLPHCLRIFHRSPRTHVLLPLLRLLQEHVRGEGTQSGQKVEGGLGCSSSSSSSKRNDDNAATKWTCH